MGLSSCDYRELDMVYYETSDVWIAVDWSKFTQETPTGMSVYCYPKNRPGDDAPYIYMTNNIGGVMVNLPIGHYDILVFNQSVDEFGSLYFEGMDKYATAEAVLESLSTKWKVKADNQTVCYEPEWLAADTYENFYVTNEMVKASALIREQLKTKTKAEIVSMDPLTKAAGSVSMKPKNLIYTAAVKIRAYGVNNIRSIRGSVTGMARSCLLHNGQRGETPITHALEVWGTDRDSDDYTKGTVFTTLRTFGLPSWMPGGSEETKDSEEYSDGTKSGNGRDREANVLNASFLLVDNKTTCNFAYKAGDRIETNDQTLTISLSFGFGSDTSQNPSNDADVNKPILLPDVKPESSGGGGFTASVDDWGEGQEIDVPLM